MGAMDVPPPRFEHFDEAVAEGLVGLPDTMGGLAGYLDIRHIEARPGLLRAEVPMRDDLANPFGNLHGGVLAALCDHVLGMVCYPVIPLGSWAATSEFKLNYLAPVTTGVLDATATIVALTRRTAVVHVDIVNEHRLVCTAQGTVQIMAPRA